MSLSPSTTILPYPYSKAYNIKYIARPQTGNQKKSRSHSERGRPPPQLQPRVFVPPFPMNPLSTPSGKDEHDKKHAISIYQLIMVDDLSETYVHNLPWTGLAIHSTEGSHRSAVWLPRWFGIIGAYLSLCG